MNQDKFMTGRNPDAFIGCLLGTAVGDALGLPYEGLSPQRAKQLFPDTTQHHFLFGKGMVSDDTEHACFVAQAIIRSQGDVIEFQRQLARSLRWWLLTLPAGIGFATLRAILKLWLGMSPKKSGVFSAGNGPAMRAPILGVAFGHDHQTLKGYVKASTEITHSDPKAYYAALAVAQAAIDVACAAISKDQEKKDNQHDNWQKNFQRILKTLINEPDANEFHDLIEQARLSAENDEPIVQFAARIGSKKGVSGYSYHTVPCVFQVWFKHGDNFEQGLQALIKAGGDTDTTGAIYGGIVGARTGKQTIPRDWSDNIIEWPRTIGWMAKLGNSLTESLHQPHAKTSPPAYFVPGILIRNFFFLIVVLKHLLRRLLPA